MKKLQSLSFLATLAIVIGMISWGSALNAQSTPPASDQQTPQTQPTPSPEMPPAAQQAPSSQTPDANAPSAQPPSSQTPPAQPPDAAAAESNAKSSSPSGSTAASGSESQTFSGTVVKQGDKYVLKDDSGKIYDIDHQTDVAKFEGKRVRVQGALDADGKILVK